MRRRQGKRIERGRIPEPQGIDLGWTGPELPPAWAEYIRAVSARTAARRAGRWTLEAADRVLGRAELARLRSCGRYWLEIERVREAGSDKIWRQAHCNSRYCPICAARDAAQKAEEIAERHENHPGTIGLLATITVGRPVPAELEALRKRKRELEAVWKALAPRLKALGCRGGVRAFEATDSPRYGIHLHLHLWLEFSSDSPLIVKDSAWLIRHRVGFSEFTPLFLAWTALVERAIEKAAPHLWAQLKPIEECWGKKGRLKVAERVARQAGIDMPRRFVSADLGGRFPGRPSRVHREAGCWKPANLIEQGPKEALKYLLKDQHSTGKMAALMGLFRGSRRFQPFGVYMRAEPPGEGGALLELPPAFPEAGPSSGLGAVLGLRLTGRYCAALGEGMSLGALELELLQLHGWAVQRRARAGPEGLRLDYACASYIVWLWEGGEGEWKATKAAAVA